MLSEIANVLSSFSYEMLNPQPLPPKGMMDWSGVREPAHPMATMKPKMPQEMLSEMAAVLRRYGFQI